MNHDNGYKLLFSHADMVGGSYVADDLREREDDIIWRVRLGRKWLCVYLLIEFQSSVDPFMAVRVLAYLGLLYQDIIRTGGLTAERLLPPVLPVVLYNGRPRWNAPEEVAERIARGEEHVGTTSD